MRVQFAPPLEYGLRGLLALFSLRRMAFAAQVFPGGFGRDQRKSQIILEAARAEGKLVDVFQNLLFVG